MLDLEAEYHLSSDRTKLLDRNHNVVATSRDEDGRTVYSPTEVQAAGKVCLKIEFKQVKVCIAYNEAQYCVGWDTVSVEYCAQWGEE